MSVKESLVNRLLQLAKKFNCFYLDGLKKGNCIPFFVDGFQVGFVRPDILKVLYNYPEVFFLSKSAVTLNPAYRDYTERSERVDEVLRDFRLKNLCSTALNGWRNECYEVRPIYSAAALFKMDRSATCLFGICNYGVDIMGYVRHPQKGMCIWLQKRSKTKPTWPGKWDNMVSGGLSVGHTVQETARKEAEEEASIPSHLLDKLRPVGSVSFFYESERGLFPNTEFVFDLELPVEFNPTNRDGEVETFELVTVQAAIERIFSPEFKTSSCPILIDFLIRHGYVTPENEPNFPQLMELLHVPLQMIYRSLNSMSEINGDINNIINSH